MKNPLLFSAAAAVALVVGAPAMAQVDWTGPYVGGNLGGSWGDTSLDLRVQPGTGLIQFPPIDANLVNLTGSDDDNKTSVTGGIQAGYNYQSGSWVFGIETDFNFLDLKQTRNNSYQSLVQINPPLAPRVTYTFNQELKTDWLWTLRPRIGYASGAWMAYITGGLATGKIKLTTNYTDTRSPPNSVTVSNSKTDTGWTGGLGGAYAFDQNWSVRGEWLYVDFGKVNHTVATPNGFATLTTEAKARANLFRVGMDYKF